ncbi:TonB-dependent receptor [Sphingopyxis sp. FBM22]|nr:TonB-dependent receptor [Sphingopyxis yananensis]
MPPSLVLVQVNGATAVTGQTGREFSFDMFSADLFSSVQVIKSSAADRDEGGVAGTINLSTPNPLDMPASTIRMNGQASYGELADKVDMRGSAMVSHKFADDRLGVMLGVSYSDRSLRQDNSSGNGWSLFSPDLDGNKNPDYVNVYAPRTLRTQLYLEDRRRIGATGKVQFRPSDSAEISLDATYSNFTVDRFRTNHSYAFADGGVMTSMTEEDGTAVKAMFNNVRNRTTVRTETVDNNLLMVNLKGHVDSGAWTLSGAANYGRAKAEMPDGAVVRFESRGTIGYDITGDYRFPDIIGGHDPRTGAGMTFNQLAFDSYVNLDEEFAVQADAERRFDSGLFSSVKFGVKLRDRTKHREATRDTSTVGKGTLLTDMMVPFPVDDFFAGQGGDNFRGWVALPDMDEVHKRFYPAVAPATLNPLDSFGVSERSYAGYARANFQFDLFGSDAVGDVGVRVVRTEQSSSGFVDDDDVISPVTIKRNYTNALPSLNLRFDPMDKLRVRLGLARVMTRPALSDISPRREIFSGQQRVEEGNVYLNPFVADQADLSVEFYLGREALLSAAFFYKNIKSFTATSETVEPFRGEDYLFSRIVNGEGGRVYGFELTYQQPFTFLPAPFNGLGTALTYTHSKSQTEFSPSMSAEKLPLEGLSRNSFNATLYYEKGPFGIRTSYNYRQGYVLTALGAGGTPVFVDDFGQLDISANLQLTPWLSIRAEALNILDERSYSYSGKINQITDYDRTGPKYFIGFSASF